MVTVYRVDDEAFELWKNETDINPNHILRFDEKDNFWEMGETGPCGPCSEIHINLSDDYDNPELVNAGLPECIELWNLVFIQYNKDKNGKLHRSSSMSESLPPADPVPTVAWYEGGEVPRHVIRKLNGLIEKATPKLLQHIPNGKYDSFVLQANDLDDCFHINLRNGLVEQKTRSEDPQGNWVRAKLNLNYLIHILIGFCDWNSAQSGLHIEWYRKDDIYDGDFYMGLYFFQA